MTVKEKIILLNRPISKLVGVAVWLSPQRHLSRDVLTD